MSTKGVRTELNPDGTLTCRICGSNKPLAEYHRNKAKSTGYESVCKPCARDKAAKWRSNNKQSRKQYSTAERSARSRASRYRNALADTNLRRGWRNVTLAFFGEKCLKCGSVDKIEMDHVIPLSKGGAHRSENIQTLCQWCNRSKHDAVADYRHGRILTDEILQLLLNDQAPTESTMGA